MGIITVKLIVYGQVQMVGYRWFAKQRADMFHIKGHVRNTSRGEVEILAQGNKDDIETFIDHLKIGPSHARVDRVTREVVTDEKNHDEFNIRM